MIFNWLSLVTGFFYIILGIVIILYKITLTNNVAYLFGTVLILYGIFRMVRSFIKLKQLKDEK
ncbi:DUF308 domain-containing protein [Halpernia sp.]|uniref:DUF308 domain-containing protein n=1 Tax=Halpernia sp. TaxID=2782209 RepID=UPI003A93F23C